MVCSAVWNHLSQVFNFLKPISGLFSIFYPIFKSKNFLGLKHHYYFHFTPIPAKSNGLILLKVQKPCLFTTYPCWLSSYIQRHRKLMLSFRYLTDQLILQSDQTTWFAVITCQQEMHGGSFLFPLLFILCCVQWKCRSQIASELIWILGHAWTCLATPYEKY